MVKYFMLGSVLTALLSVTIAMDSGWRWFALAIYLLGLLVAGISETDHDEEKTND